MKGLIKYDLLQLASSMKGGFALLYLIMMAVLSVVSDVGSIFGYVMVMIGTMFGISAFNYEEAYHWDRYTAALPISVRGIVLARYLFVLICTLFGVAASLILGIVTFVSGHMDMSVFEWAVSCLVIFLISMIYIEVMVPVMYRFGSEKGRIVMMLFFLVIFATIFVAGNLTASLELVSPVVVTGICTAVVLILFPISLSISVKVRANKEF